jgi:tetratricopeptide (TPR) repeat protein
VPDAEILTSSEAFRRAAILHDDGRFEDAEALLRGAIVRDPANADLRHARGVIFAAMGRHLDALWCYRDAIAVNPSNAGIWTNLGNTLTRLKHLKSAVACHRTALQLARRDDALLYQNLGASLAEALQHGEAVAALCPGLRNRSHAAHGQVGSRTQLSLPRKLSAGISGL